ncbi:MAG: hypothetical protein ABI824_10130 [Acidobacteriota bacterium]
MSTADRSVSIHPYFKVHDGKLDEFRKICEQFVATTLPESKCLYYGFSFNGNEVHCREKYTDASGLLEHLDHVGPILAEAAKITDLARLEIHGIESELAKLREPLAGLESDLLRTRIRLLPLARKSGSEQFATRCGFKTGWSLEYRSRVWFPARVMNSYEPAFLTCPPSADNPNP